MQERNKTLLRTELRRIRQTLSSEQVMTDSLHIVSRLLTEPRVSEARTVLLYLPTKGEVDTWPLLSYYRHQGSRILLPRCRPDQPGLMDIFAVASPDQLGPGSHGLIEPIPELATLEAAPQPDVVFVPAVAYDLRGNRIGFGGGYYDRFLPTLPVSTLLVGLAYAFQIVDHIESDPWDCPVHRIATPDFLLTPEEP